MPAESPGRPESHRVGAGGGDGVSDRRDGEK